jgi:phenylacetate 2-hydroxylase
MRYFPNNEKNRRSMELRERRDKYLNYLLEQVKSMVEVGTDKPCIASAIIKGDNERLNDGIILLCQCLLVVELGSICLSLVSGGFETIPGTLTSVIGSLSTKEGQNIQKAAYDSILESYGGDRDAAWKDCIAEEKVDYINAVVKEGVRFYTVSSMSLPRKAIEGFYWHGSLIPKGTMILISFIPFEYC